MSQRTRGVRTFGMHLRRWVQHVAGRRRWPCTDGGIGGDSSGRRLVFFGSEAQVDGLPPSTGHPHIVRTTCNTHRGAELSVYISVKMHYDQGYGRKRLDLVKGNPRWLQYYSRLSGRGQAGQV